MGKQSDTFTMPPKSRKGGVQSEFVRVRDIAHNVLCLASPTSPTSPTQREYRAILEVSATNYTLRSEEEQESMITGYRSFLKSLTFPIQILVRSQQLDLRPYVQNVLESSTDHAAWHLARTGALSRAVCARTGCTTYPARTSLLCDHSVRSRK